MPYSLNITESAQGVIGGVRDPGLKKKIPKCLGFLELDPSHNSLASHRFESFDALYGEKVWESYVENATPSAWRVWWFYGPADGEITIVDIGPHP